MSDTVAPKRKLLIFGILFFILVVLPAGSWFYLRGGLNWRRQAQAELQDYGKIRAAFIIYADGTKENQLKGKVTVVHFFGATPDLTDANKKILNTAEGLVQQYGYKPGKTEDYFRIAMIAEGGTAEFKTHAQTLPSADLANWVWTGGLGSWTTILTNAYDSYCQRNHVQPGKEYFALADTSGTIRCFYDATNDKAIGRMVEHIALLLPVK